MFHFWPPFAVRLTAKDGRTAYLSISRYLLRDGDHVVPNIVRKRQEEGKLPHGEIVSIKRVR